MTAIPIVLLPGMHGTGDMMTPLARLLGAGRAVRLITYPVDTPLGYDSLVPYVTERLPPGRFVILGESFSGPLAIEIAARKPTRTTGLILAASFASAPLPRWLRHLSRFVPFPVLSTLVNAVLLGKSTRSHPEIAAALRTALTEVSAATLRLRMIEALTVDKRALLAATTCPLLLLAGARDRLIRPHCLRDILTARPDAQLREFDAPHMLLETHSAAASAAIAQFCDEISD